MTSISINETTRAASLDTAVAFSVLFEEHRLLVSQSVSSGFKGLIKSLDELSSYSRAVESLQDAIKSLEEAMIHAMKDPFETNGTTANSSVVSTVNQGLNTQAAPYSTTIGNALTQATNALNGTSAGTPERAAAESLKAAADKAKAAIDQIRAGDAIGGFAKIEQALADAQSARTQAENALTNAIAARNAAYTQYAAANNALGSALAANPQVPANIAAAQIAFTAAQNAYNAAEARVTAASAVVTAANSTVNAAQGLVNFKSEPIAQIKLTTTQQCYELGDGYDITVWGTTGYATLTGPDGKGILIQPDGSVDPLDGSGNGWRFATTSTFVLPNETKITITPNTNGAVISAIKGRNHLELTNVKSGGTPQGTITADGRRYDATTIDGYRIDLSISTDAWKLGTNVLGDTGSREQVAQTASTNQFPMDASDIEVPPELQAFLDRIGLDISQFDLDGDGKLNEEEFYQVSTILQTVVVEMQSSFQSILLETMKAGEALTELNRFLEGIQKQGQDVQDGKTEASAAEREELAAIQSRLESALAGLQALQGGGGGGGTSVSSAEALVTKLLKAAQGEDFEPSSGASLPQVNTLVAPPSQSSGTEPPAADPVSQAFRRAGLLLSGLSGGFQIDESLFPGAPTLPGLTGDEVSLLASLASLGLPLSTADAEALLTLVGKLQAELANGGMATLNGEGLQLLESVKATLAQVGLVPLSEENSLFLAALAAQLRGLNIGLAETFQLEELLARLQRGPNLEEASSAATGLSTDVRNLTIADVQRLEAILTRLQDLPLGLSSEDATRLNMLLRLLTGDLQNESTPAAGVGDFTGRPVTRADIQLFEELMFRLRGEDPDSVATSGPEATSSGNPFIQNLELLKTVTGNFQTDPELLEKLKDNVSKTVQTYNEHLTRARSLFIESQETVETFVKLVAEDDTLREVIEDDQLSDEKQEDFAEKMQGLHQKWGMEWGSDEPTPTDEGKLVSRMAQSGMMI